MEMRRFPICLTAILVSGCVSAATTVMTEPETFEHIVCHRPGPTVGLGTGVVVQNLYETRCRQCIENAKNAGFLPPLNTGTDIADTSQRVVAVRGDAERAGIRTGDKLVKVEGFDMSAPEGRRDCYEHLAHKLPGDSITVWSSVTEIRWTSASSSRPRTRNADGVISISLLTARSLL